MNQKIKKLYSRANTSLKNFYEHKSGSAAVEFVFIAPLLITLYLGTMEISQGVEMNKKVGRAASVIGDLIAQSDELSNTEIEDIMKIGAAVLQPYNRGTPTITVTAIAIDAAKNGKVAWSRRGTGTTYSRPYALDSAVVVPTNIAIADTFLIKVETALEYLPITSWTIQKNKTNADGGTYATIDMAETYYLRPRLESTVTCTGC